MQNKSDAEERTSRSVKDASGLKRRGWPVHGWAGIVLIALFWALNWMLPGLRTHWAFFPLWLGYCLFADGIVLLRKGSSLFTRNRRAYVGLFLTSIPVWWLFELINCRTENWSYLGRENFSDMEFFLLSSLNFSVVVPAVFGTAELAGTISLVKKLGIGPRIPLHPQTARTLVTAGMLMSLLVALWPRYFFPLVWGAVYLLLEPINLKLGNRTLLADISKGDWKPVVSLFIGSLTCGFFWELWNYYSYPKWVYKIPYVDYLHVFEMPILGYAGYLPFALELFALYHLLLGLRHRHLNNYIQFA